MLIMIDGQMINRFIDDVDSFRQCANDRFCSLDGDGDGFLSRSDFQKSIPSSSSVDQIFDRFDADGSGGIDREEFRPIMMEMLIAMARGFGGVPVNVGVESDSLLLRVYEHDLARIEREKKEKEKQKNNNNEFMVESVGNNNITGRKLRKKRTRNIFGMCACSPKYLGDNDVD